MLKAPARFVWMNGEALPWEKATVHVLTHALHYGSGVFEGIRAYGVGDEVLVFRLRDHIRRMVDSAKIYSFDLPYGEDEICEAVLQLIRKNDFHSSLYIRPIAFKGVGGISLDATTIPISVSIMAFPYEKYFNANKLGLDVCVSTWRRVGEPAVPAMAKACGHYINSVLARTEATQAGFDEALFLDESGNISEGTGENIFIVKDELISTPSLASNILNGITRQTIISLVKDLEMPLAERPIARAELYTCDEAFFTGTAAEVAPIVSIDRKPVGNRKPGPITIRLREEYERIVTGSNERYLKYLTPVYGNAQHDVPATRLHQR
jgi:branched-chain amino acid aminotransferase